MVIWIVEKQCFFLQLYCPGCSFVGKYQVMVYNKIYVSSSNSSITDAIKLFVEPEERFYDGEKCSSKCKFLNPILHIIRNLSNTIFLFVERKSYNVDKHKYEPFFEIASMNQF